MIIILNADGFYCSWYEFYVSFAYINTSHTDAKPLTYIHFYQNMGERNDTPELSDNGMVVVSSTLFSQIAGGNVKKMVNRIVMELEMIWHGACVVVNYLSTLGWGKGRQRKSSLFLIVPLTAGWLWLVMLFIKKEIFILDNRKFMSVQWIVA